MQHSNSTRQYRSGMRRQLILVHCSTNLQLAAEAVMVGTIRLSSRLPSHSSLSIIFSPPHRLTYSPRPHAGAMAGRPRYCVHAVALTDPQMPRERGHEPAVALRHAGSGPVDRFVRRRSSNVVRVCWVYSSSGRYSRSRTSLRRTRGGLYDTCAGSRSPRSRDIPVRWRRPEAQPGSAVGHRTAPVCRPSDLLSSGPSITLRPPACATVARLLTAPVADTPPGTRDRLAGRRTSTRTPFAVASAALTSGGAASPVIRT